MLHGPWIADALRNYFTGAGTGGGGGGGGSTTTTFDLSAFINTFNSMAPWNGTYLTGATGTGYAEFTFDNASIDPAKTYTIDVDYTVTQGAAGWFRTYAVKGPTETEINASSWHELGPATTNLTGTGTHTFQIGPGLQEWDIAMPKGDTHLLFEIKNYVQIARVAITEGTTGTTMTLAAASGDPYPNGVLDLSTYINFDDSTAWNGSHLAAATPGGFGQFSFPYALDPTDTITFVIDYTVGSGTNAGLYLHSSKGPSSAEWSTSVMRSYRENEGLSGSGTLTFDVGPGLASFDAAMTAGEPYIVFELARDMQITAIAIEGSVDAGPADPGGGEPGTAPVIKAMAMDVTHIPTAGTASRSGLTGEITGGGYPAGGVEVSGLTVTWDDPNSRVVVTCDLIDFGAVTATDVAAVVFYADNGSPSADRVLWTDTFPPVSAAGSLTYEPHPDGVMEIRV